MNGGGGGSMHGNGERGAGRQMDDYLKAIGLHRKKIAKDGSCLFRAVAEQVLHCQSLHTQVRAECVAFLKENRESYEAFIEGDFEEYLVKLQDPQQWVGEVEINALAVMYKRDFLIFQEPGKPAVNITDNNFKDKVRLCFLNGNHYDSVYSISHVKDAALCQSILYELLYDDVFRVERSALSMCQRVARPNDFLSDDNMHACVSSDESDVDPGEPLWEEVGASAAASRHTSYRGRGGRGRLSDRVRRSLNPTLFRNIEYDVWHKSKRAQQKRDYFIAAGMQFTVGNRCQVQFEGRTYSATIKEVSPDNGPVTVYLEELGSRKQVSLWSLRPLSDENSWSTVVTRDKRLSNGHGEWEEKGRGRGRGRHVPASSSSSVTQATAPGSTGGRLLKQQSWPPQSAVEDQGGAKASSYRKSVSTIESAFGVTEAERLAKEEEERNVALVEIQLRDEQSFPALGMQSDGGRRKGSDKRKLQRNKTKSPVEDVGAPSPSTRERPKSSTPPPLASSSSSSAAAAAPSTNTTTPIKPTLPAALSAKSDSAPPWLSSIKASTTPNLNMAGAAAAGASSSACSLPVAHAAPKTNAPSDASTQISLPVAAGAKSPVTGGAVPPSIPSSAALFSFLTPALPSASSTPTPPAPPSSSLSSLLPDPSASPPPRFSSSSSSVPPPTFIAPIAPSAAAAHGFLPPPSLPRSSPPVSSLPHSPSPPSFSSSSLIHQADPVDAAPPASARISLPYPGGTLTASQTFQSQASLSQIQPHMSLPPNQSPFSVSQTQTQSPVLVSQTQTQPSLLQKTQILTLQMQNEAHSCYQQLQPQSHSEVASLPQTQPSAVPPSFPQASISHLQSQYPLQAQSQYPSQAQYSSQAQSEVAQAQSSHSAPAASFPLPSQTSVPVPASLQPPVTHPHLHVQTPPHPTQVPHPSLSLSTSHPSPHPHSITQNQTEAPLPPAQPHPESPAHPPPPPAHHPQLQSAPPHHHPSIPGAVPLQQLSQLYQDPLYPGFPQGEKGEVAPTPAFSSSQSGQDLPLDLNVLKFFFNLGVKAYSMPMFPPYMYLLPLQQAHTLHPKLPSRSPSPPPQYPPSRHQDEYTPYPPTSASMPPQYDHQALPAEPPHPSDPSFNQAGYPVHQAPSHRVSWQQHQVAPPRNPNYSVGYHSQSPSYLASPPLSQGYHPGQAQGHLYPQYPPSSMGYQSSPNPEELQVGQGALEQRQPTNGDAMPGRGAGLGSPAAANMDNANNNRTGMAPGFAIKNEQGDCSTKMVLLVDPPLNNTPIMKLVSNTDVPMATIKPGSSPGSPTPYDVVSKTAVHGDDSPGRGYRGHRKHLGHASAYVPPGPSDSYLTTVAMPPDSLSVGCSTEDDWEEPPGFRPPTFNPRVPRKVYRGGRGRGGHDSGRGAHRRRQGGEVVGGLNYVQFNSSHRGRGREREY